MSAIKKQHLQIAQVSLDGEPDRQTVVGLNRSLTTALLRNRAVEVEVVNVPDERSDLYRQRIILMKSAASKDDPIDRSEDLVSLDDLVYTDLPWMGMVSINPYGSRQFRSKNHFTAAVEVIREFNGLLYGLYCGVAEERYKLPPVLVTVKAPTRHQANYRIITDSDPSDEMKIKHLGEGIPEVPPQLEDELIQLGFTRNGNRFVIGEDISTNIAVQFFGKIITPVC